MSELYFNHAGATHSLRIRAVDVADNVIIYEALVDGRVYVFWEAPPDLEVWDLFSCAINAYRDEVEDDSTESIEPL